MSTNQKKRIALIVNTLSSGGAEHVVANLSRALSGHYEIDLVLNDEKNIAYQYEGNIISIDMPADGDRLSAKYQTAALIKRTALLRKLKRQRQYAAAISFSDNTNLSNVLSGSRYGKTIVSIRYSLKGKEKSEKKKAYIHRISTGISLLLADSIVCCSKEIADEIKQRYSFANNKLKVIYNGIESRQAEQINLPNSEAQNRHKDDVKINSKARPTQIVTVGRLTEQKAQWHLLYAIKELKDRGIDANLTILGEGPLRRDLERLCKSLNISDRVSMPGWADDPTGIMSCADIAVFTSTYEGFSNAIIEAMACGLPCISTDHSTGAREIMAPGTDWNDKVKNRIEHAEFGILVPISESDFAGRTDDEPDNAEILLADAIQEIIQNDEMADKYRTASLQRAEDLSLESAAEKWIAEIEAQ